MSRILDALSGDQRDVIEAAAEALRAGRLVVLPTDTVYGVAADAFNPTGTAAVFEAKRRARTFPLPVLIRSPKQLLGLVTKVPPAADRLMSAYWPGSLTIVVACDPNLSWDLGRNEGTVAVRMPFDDVTLDIIRSVGPLAVTSANLSGQPAARDVEAARHQLGNAVEVYVDAGPRRGQQPSTIVDLTRAEPHILREGTLPSDEVLRVARGELDPMEATQLDPPSVPDRRPTGVPADAAEAAIDRPSAEDDRQRLLTVPGLGPAKADALLEHFGGLEAVRNASPDELTAARGVGPALAERIKGALDG